MNKIKLYKILFITLPFLFAFPFHFLFNYIPFPLFAIFFPTNESIFEHTKLTFTPIIITYILFFFIYKKHIKKEAYLTSLLISILVSSTSMLVLYYLYFIIFSKDIVILSVLSLFVAILLGQIIGILTYKKGIAWSKEICIYSLITISVIFLILTINPPYLKFFFDESKNSYGI